MSYAGIIYYIIHIMQSSSLAVSTSCIWTIMEELANICQALWYHGLQFYSDLSIAATLAIQIVFHVYEPFSRGVVLPFSHWKPCCPIRTCYVKETNARTTRKQTDLNDLTGPFSFNDHILCDYKSWIDFIPCEMGL